MKHHTKLKAIVALFLVLSVGSFWIYQTHLPLKVSLHFHPVIDGNALRFNIPAYSNPGGPGQISLRDFQFYISNVKLSGEDTVYVEPESYHLARFDQPTGNYVIEMEGVPSEHYSQLEFAIGVDKEANASIRSVGDLDPNSRMAWNWEVGYKFLLLEGMLIHDGISIPLVYHVGFNESYRQLSFNLPRSHRIQSEQIYTFKVNPLAIFSGNNPINMLDLSSIKFNKSDAIQIANQFPQLIELK